LICIYSNEKLILLPLASGKSKGKKVCMEKVAMIKAADGPFTNSLYFTAGALARTVEKLAIECWKPTGLSPSLGHLLFYLIHYANVTGPTIIARNLRLSPSTVTRLLGKLEKKALVYRFEYDRTRMVRATPEAWQLEPLITECEFAFRKRCIALLGESVELTCEILAATTDTLTAGASVRTLTEKPAENTDI
jgi:MarR family transcriptional regulator, organic hydroperoxide resistance regulator